MQAVARACPAGSFCADSQSIQECPAGTYCIEGSSQQYSCNYSQLLMQDAYARIPAESPTVVERIYLRGDPLGGNFCPAGADTPLTTCAPCAFSCIHYLQRHLLTQSCCMRRPCTCWQCASGTHPSPGYCACRCQGGYYCPSVDQQILCPRGHFCPPQSMAPQRCVVLAPCPPGTTAPIFSFTWILFVAFSAGVMLAVFLNVMRGERIQQQRAERAARHEILNMVRTLLIRLQKTHGGDTQRMLLVEPIVRIEFQELRLQLRGRAGQAVLSSVSGTYPPGAHCDASCMCVRRPGSDCR